MKTELRTQSGMSMLRKSDVHTPLRKSFLLPFSKGRIEVGWTLFPLLFRKIIHHKSYIVFLFFFLFLTSIFQLPNSADAAVLSKPANNLGLVGYWPMNEGTSTSAGDFSGNGNSGTMYPGTAGTNVATSTMWVNGKRGKAINFDGTDDYVSVPHSASQCTTNITYALWIKKDATQNNTAPRAIWKSPDSPRIFYASQTSNTLSVIYQLTTDGGTTRTIGTTPPGVWTHVAFTYDGSNFYTYLNGVQANNYSVTDTAASCSGVLKIGRETAREFAGSLDDVRIYSRALTGAEIYKLYGSGSAVRKVANKRGLIANYSFDDGAGTKLGDYSGNKRDTTLSNTDSNSGGWIKGKKGKAFMFDGGDDQATVPASVYSAVSPSEGTIMGWGYATTTCSNCFMVWAVGAGDSRYYLQWTSGWIVYRGNLSGVTVLSTANAKLNRWYHIALTWEGGNMYGYLDGRLIGSKAWVGDSNSPTSMNIGRQGSNPGFTGALDDIKMYDRALTGTEIFAEYSQSSAVLNAPQNDQLTDGLVGLWSFNGKDIDSTYVYDRSSNANHGYFFGVATSSAVGIGKAGQGFALDGVNDTTRIPDSTSLDFGTGNYTVAGWAYLDSSKLELNKEYGFINKNATYQASAGLGIEVSTYGGVAPFATATVSGYNSGQATWGNSNTSSIIFNTNEWHHFTLIRSGSTHTMYVDGVLRATKTHADVALDVDNAQPVVIGDHSWGPSFPGKIDEVRTYNRALTAAEVKRLYNLGR